MKKTIYNISYYITCFRLQVEEAKHFKNFKVPGGTVVNFLLTSKGYLALGIEKSESKLKENFCDPYFIKGMGSDWVRNNLKDLNPASNWEKAYLEKKEENGEILYKPKDIHALLILADNDKSNLGQKVRFFLRDVLGIGSKGLNGTKGGESKKDTPKGKDEEQELVEIITAEHAILQRNDYGQVIEHFGFRDGISNPLFLESDCEDIDKYGGYSEWDPRSPLSLALIKDPYGKNEDLSFGSYLVYRKYEQHVKTFELLIKNLSADLHPENESESVLEMTRALVMGRFRDGVPLALKGEGRRYSYENYNNFNYEDDSVGIKCPLHAHIRKVNHRPLKNKKDYTQIVRRGMTYGERKNYNSLQLDSLPNQDVGLLFMSFQASIAEQFAPLQIDWANDPNKPQPGTGRDNIIGQGFQYNDGQQINEPKRWPLEWNTSKYKYSNAMQSCISLRGGEFFFAPSISFLKNIDNL